MVGRRPVCVLSSLHMPGPGATNSIDGRAGAVTGLAAGTWSSVVIDGSFNDQALRVHIIFMTRHVLSMHNICHTHAGADDARRQGGRPR